MTPLELHRSAVYKNQRALDLLDSDKADAPLSRAQIEQCFDNGAVWLEAAGKPQRLRDCAEIVPRGHKLHLYCNDATLAACPFGARLVEDFSTFSIWFKPAGMLSQGSKWGDHWALYRWIEQRVWPDRRCFITHRLDRYTSGLMIVAHDAATNQAFHQLFEQRKINKTYRAIVRGALPPDSTQTLDSAIEGKAAVSHIRVIDSDAKRDLSLLEIHPETGRKHQIRIHLAGSGHAVLNDRRYGPAPHTGDLQLQASALAFSHPLDQARIEVALPTEQLLTLAPTSGDQE